MLNGAGKPISRSFRRTQALTDPAAISPPDSVELPTVEGELTHAGAASAISAS